MFYDPEDVSKILCYLTALFPPHLESELRMFQHKLWGYMLEEDGGRGREEEEWEEETVLIPICFGGSLPELESESELVLEVEPELDLEPGKLQCK